MKASYIIQGSKVTVVVNGKPHVISSSHPTYKQVLDAIKADSDEMLENVIDPKKYVLEYGKGNIEVQGDKLFWKGEEFHNSLARRMIGMLQEGFDISPMVNFMENLMSNPSKRAVTELYGFLEKNSLPVTPDGCFLAYKKVRENYLDCHSGTVLNKPAVYMTDEDKEFIKSTTGGVQVTVENGVTVVTMERNKVDDDQNHTCSTGLHFCSQEYLKHFCGERIVILKINPRDVCAIPNDYNDSKGRTCRYEIVDEIDKEKADEAFAKSVQVTAEKSASVLTDEDLDNLAKLYAKVKANKLANTE